ncbi:hypothetical protein KC622_01445 [Candidatus Dojkabacteria bacterium]|uniref:Uncharacterized protein n=1 Tax=Candidatus Dojkabacteria bacterium TaxID=2099670 RepID=A0A955KWC2_9BACT|nr:hypothetical protein [Candidatus Dojkabacteria bacterium]
MISVKIDPLKSINDNVRMHSDGEVKYTFEVAPVDYIVKDYNSPKFYISEHKLIFSFDDQLEVYNLQELELEVIGSKPMFSVFQQILEGRYYYTGYGSQAASFEKLKKLDTPTRFSLTEPQKVPREFYWRKSFEIGKGYQTWAMAKIIILLKNKQQVDPLFNEMLEGEFSTFNSKTVFLFTATFAFYVLLKITLLKAASEFLDNVFDGLFIIILIGFFAWTIMSINKNLKRFETLYNSSSIDSPAV